MFESSYTNIAGTFVKISAADQINLALQRNSPIRPEARYNRRGQNALYLSVDERSARVAMRKYAKDITAPLVLVRFEVEACQLVDLQHADMSAYKTRASQGWQAAIANGYEPASWEVADLLRENQAIGLIDPSRKDPDTWHVTLFRWNEPGAPMVNIVGDPTPISII